MNYIAEKLLFWLLIGYYFCFYCFTFLQKTKQQQQKNQQKQETQMKWALTLTLNLSSGCVRFAPNLFNMAAINLAPEAERHLASMLPPVNM